MGEALFNSIGDGVYKAYSAGIAPLGIVNRFAIEEIKTINYPINSLRSKSFHEFSYLDAPKINFVIVMGYEPSKETLPEWLGGAIKAYWHMDDPTQVKGSFEEKKEVFKNSFQTIQSKVELFTQLPLAHLNQDRLDSEMAKWDAMAAQESS